MQQWTLITGASSGIGHELAKLFAADGFNLILVARNEARLNVVAEELKSAYRIETKIISKDLAQPNAAGQVFEMLHDTPVSVLVNNAAFGNYGAFAKSELRNQSEMMQTNMVALVELTHLVLQPMLSRGSGRILNVASTAAFQPGPLVNVYYASKAFVFSFSYALAVELEGTGITVTTLCPGATRTNFFERAHMHMKRPIPMMDAGQVARNGYRALMEGKRVVIPGVANQLTSFFAKRMPPCLTAGVVRRIHEHTKQTA